MTKPAGTIETKAFGLAKAFDRIKYEDALYWRVTFDTGLFMFVPDRLFETMTFNLDQVDAPKR
jgi:hypothetical protein